MSVVVVERLQLCITCVLMVFSEKISNFLSLSEAFKLPTGSFSLKFDLSLDQTVYREQFLHILQLH